MAVFHAPSPKFALVSHVLPPAPSGQAIVLSRLLRDTDPEQYCLISVSNYSQATKRATHHLPGAYFSLDPEPDFRLMPMARSVRSAALSIGDQLRSVVGQFFNNRNESTMAEFTTAPDRTLSPSWSTGAKSIAHWADDRMHLRRNVYQRAAQIFRIITNEHCTAIVACSGDLIDLPASSIAARWAKIPFFAYMFDDYSTTSISDFQRRFSQGVIIHLMREATGVVVPNEFLASAYQSRYGVHPWLIPNPIDLAAAPVPRFRPMHTPARLLYTGAIYEAHFDAVHRLIHTIKSMGSSAPELHIYTSSTRPYLAQHQICQPAIIHGAVSTEESIRLQQDADILFLPLAFNSSIPDTINTSAPGKMGELLASGRPVLVHAPKESFVSWYFRKHDCGEVVDEKDPAKLRQAIDRLQHDSDHSRKLASRAKERARCDFSLPIARNRFFEMLNSSTRRLVA